jgi:hypothetical protein
VVAFAKRGFDECSHCVWAHPCAHSDPIRVPGENLVHSSTTESGILPQSVGAGAIRMPVEIALSAMYEFLLEMPPPGFGNPHFSPRTYTLF